MAYYTWKAVRDQIPNDFIESWCKSRGIEDFDLYDCEAYNWDYWLMVSDYIKSIKANNQEESK